MTERRARNDTELFNPELQTSLWKRRLKASEPGRVLAAVYRRRRMPKQIWNAPGGRRAERLPVPPTRRRVRMVLWMPAGPGDLPALLDTYASAVASSPGEVVLLVTDDWTPDAHAAAILATVPDAIVVRPRVPSGGPPRLWPVTSLAIRTALSQFDFDYLVKLDTDAIVVGPGFVAGIDAAVQRTAAAAVATGGAPGDNAPADALVGIAGSFRERPDGEHETDQDYHRRVLDGECPRDEHVAGWRAQAVQNGWVDGTIVQGGTLVLTHELCVRIAAAGGLAYQPRVRTIVSEDLLLTLLAYATGMRAASLGGPAGPLAIANKHLPLPLDELLDPASRWLGTHSTKIGLDGELEPEIRSAARAARASWPGAAS